jgi:hypothetical protein
MTNNIIFNKLKKRKLLKNNGQRHVLEAVPIITKTQVKREGGQ